MRRFLIAFVVISLVGGGAAVVGGPNASEGEMTITSGSSASASAAVGPNGTEWRSSIENRNSSCRGPEDSENISFTGFQSDGNFTELSFKGSVNTSNPCVELGLETSEIGENTYQLEIVESPSEGICTQCVGTARFEGSFAAKGDYRVEIVHEGEILDKQKTPGFSEREESPGSEPEGAGVWKGFSSILEWLGSIL